MALHLRTVLMSYLVLISLMKDAKPVLAEGQTALIEKLRQHIENLEERLKECRNFAGLEDSEILNNDASFLETLSDFLKPVVHNNSQWRRCWQASEDGWSLSTFHSRCDHKGPTVTIVRVGHYIFGGYTSISWGGSCEFHYDSAAFMFSLVNKPGWQPVKLEQTGVYSHLKERSIKTCSTYGPTFGTGHDLHIADQASSNTNYWVACGTQS